MLKEISWMEMILLKNIILFKVSNLQYESRSFGFFLRSFSNRSFRWCEVPSGILHIVKERIHYSDSDSHLLGVVHILNRL